MLRLIGKETNLIHSHLLFLLSSLLYASACLLRYILSSFCVYIFSYLWPTHPIPLISFLYVCFTQLTHILLFYGLCCSSCPFSLLLISLILFLLHLTTIVCCNLFFLYSSLCLSLSLFACYSLLCVLFVHYHPSLPDSLLCNKFAPLYFTFVLFSEPLPNHFYILFSKLNWTKTTTIIISYLSIYFLYLLIYFLYHDVFVLFLSLSILYFV